MIKVIIADDHHIFLDGLQSLLKEEEDIEVVGEALNGEQALDLLEKHEVDVALLDVRMPKMDGLEATKVIVKKYPKVKILALTMHKGKDSITGLLEAGAMGYVLKNTRAEELVKAIKTVHAGATFYSDEVTKTVMASYRQRKAAEESPVQLTSREKEVLRLIVNERTTQEIANELHISPHTVDTHRKNLLSKLNLHNTAGLVRYALENGIVK